MGGKKGEFVVKGLAGGGKMGYLPADITDLE